MKGLLIKDWKLLKQQGRFYLTVLLLAVMMLISGSKSYASFVTSYMTFLVAVFSFTTFSLDEYDNGMSFLMTLPAGRRMYVKEKYIFSILLLISGWLMAVLLRFTFITFRFSMQDWMEDAPTEPIYLLLALIFISCSIPCFIKFGVEKGRMGAMLAVAAILFGFYSLDKIGIARPFFRLLEQMMTSSVWSMVGILLIISLLILLISYLCSLKLIEKKEF